MRYEYTSPAGHDIFGWGQPRPDTIRTLLVLNIGTWVLITLSGTERLFFPLLGLVPQYVWSKAMIWQPLTYLFLHAGFWHLAMNMLALWMFGSELEREWGGPAFLRFFIITGVGAGLVTVLFTGGSTIPVVGASGAIYGVLLAYGLAYPNREVYLYFMFPVKVKYFVGFLAVMAFVASIQQGASGVSHLTHLSGMIIAWFYLKSGWGRNWLGLTQQVKVLHTAYRERQSARQENLDMDMREQVDAILDKINASGYSSLTQAEQDTLHKAAVKFSKKSDQN
ncbi:MAG: rhomboid family intramembrane serine protease [Candidatus Marinimicrobia bacterium]|nr:rhomboid family intramembrane serine protease [Candidatus Neomarinimicrobiota bacterium]